MSVLSPPATLLTKLGSIARHADEALCADGHEFDVASIKALLGDPEVAEWLEGMDALALLPVTRHA